LSKLTVFAAIVRPPSNKFPRRPIHGVGVADSLSRSAWRFKIETNLFART
jgi:hypothetical protein